MPRLSAPLPESASGRDHRRRRDRVQRRVSPRRGRRRRACCSNATQLGSGSTSRAAGGVRAQFSDPLNIQIAQRSLAAFREFARRPGWEIDLKQVGYLFVLSRDADVGAFEQHVALQNELRGPVADADRRGRPGALCPLLAGDDIVAGAFSPDDGHVTPEAVVQGYAYAARALGAQHARRLRGDSTSGVRRR